MFVTPAHVIRIFLQVSIVGINYTKLVAQAYRVYITRPLTQFRWLTYTLNHKKRDILFLTITLANLNRFFLFLHHFDHEKILHATVVEFTTLF